MKNPDIWLQPGELIGEADCGCKLNAEYGVEGESAFFFCPLHQAAGELLELLKEYVGIATLTAMTLNPMKTLKKAQQAIAKAEGKS